MVKFCYLCKREFNAVDLKTSRMRFKVMGLPAPTGMGESDRICGKCLKKIHHETLQKIRISQIKKGQNSENFERN